MSKHAKSNNRIRLALSKLVAMTAALTLGGVMHSCKKNAEESTPLSVDLSNSSTSVKDFSAAFLVNLESSLLAINVSVDTVSAILAEIRASVGGLGLVDSDDLSAFLNQVSRVLDSHLPESVAQLLTASVANFTTVEVPDLASSVQSIATAIAGNANAVPDLMKAIAYFKANDPTAANIAVDELLTSINEVSSEDVASVCPVSEAANVALAPSAHPPVDGVPGEPDGSIWKCFTFGPCKLGPTVGKGSGSQEANLFVTCDSGLPVKITVTYPESYNCNDPNARNSLMTFLNSTIPQKKLELCGEVSPSVQPSVSSTP